MGLFGSSRKYEILPDVITLDDPRRSKPVELHQIRALRNVGSTVRKGDYGGLIESESNLSQDGECWVCMDAIVWGNARIYENAFIGGNLGRCDMGLEGCEMWGRVNICDNAQVYGNALVAAGSRVKEYGKVYGNATVFMTGEVSGNAQVHENGSVTLGGKVKDNARVFENGTVTDLAVVGGDACVLGNATIQGEGTSISSGRHRS